MNRFKSRQILRLVVYNKVVRNELLVLAILCGCGSASTNVDESQADHLKFETDASIDSTFLGATSDERIVKLRNDSGRSVTVAWDIESENEEFSVNAGGCPAVPANGECEITVTYAPLAKIGERTGTITVTDIEAESVKKLTVSGRGKVTLAVTHQTDGVVTLLADNGDVDGRIECGESFTKCQVELGDESDQMVTLKANDGPSKYFAGWATDCSGTEATCELSMNGDRVVSSTYNDYIRVNIEVDPGPTSGGVLFVPSTSGACTPTGNYHYCALYRPGTSLRMDAIDDDGTAFESWTFPNCNTPNCSITVGNTTISGTVFFCPDTGCV